MIIDVFRRKETKYLLTESQYRTLMKRISAKLGKNDYFESHIYNLYFDTDRFDLAITSINKPPYKEKVRIRSYEKPNDNTRIFLEVKKKHEGIVGKRRIYMPLKEFNQYLKTGNFSDKKNQQIKDEIDFYFKQYKLKPKLMIAYDRLSYFAAEDPDFRITFDQNLRSRTKNYNIKKIDGYNNYFDQPTYIMEVKALSAYPMWFVKTLSNLKIYPQSFTKYGNVYIKTMKENQYV